MLGLIETPVDWIGAALYFISFLFILTFAFQKSKTWGFLVLIFSPISTAIFVLLNWKTTSFWFAVMIAGLAVLVVF